MELDARHVRGDKLVSYYLSVSMLYGESLRILHPSPEQLQLIEAVAGFCKAELKGAGVGSEVCFFTPTKISKTYDAELGVVSSTLFLQTVLPTILFCGHQVKLTLSGNAIGSSSYYIRDVLLPHLHRYIEFSHMGIDETTVSLQLKGRYLLESAPLCVIRAQPELVALRGEIHTPNDSLYSFVSLALKDYKVPVRLHHSQTKKSFIHLNALFGTVEGYDNDHAYILFAETNTLETTNHAQEFLSIFKSVLVDTKLSIDLIEDLLLIVALVGGELPGVYEETTLMLEEVDTLSFGKILEQGTSYVCRF